MAREIRLHISGMIYNQTMGGTYSLVMSEDEGLRRRFSVLIGESEAQSIALKLNNAKPPRPLSHNFIQSICDLGINPYTKSTIVDYFRCHYS